jgi:hypothetical protein
MHKANALIPLADEAIPLLCGNEFLDVITKSNSLIKGT